MKELSIEQKAKRYDEAIETTRKWYDSNTNDGYRGIFEDIFPELKESKDEKIRKALVRFHKTIIDIDGIKGEEIIAWLEKQCQVKNSAISQHINETCKENVNSLTQEPVSEDFDALDQLLAKYAIDFSYKGKTLKECSGRYKAEIIATANHLEPVSEDLEEASKEWLAPQLDKSYAAYGETKQMELTHFDGYAMLDAIDFGAKWQKAKDQKK